jgi:hypothetical protein
VFLVVYFGVLEALEIIIIILNLVVSFEGTPFATTAAIEGDTKLDL